ncbi:MAG: hypothetical protein V4844_20880 [Pseudomonadota bacterium]
MFQRRHVLSLIATAAAAIGAPPAAAVGRLVEMELVDRGRGEVLTTHLHRGASWVAGRPGTRYAVRLSNRSRERVLVVLSVDGVNAVSGETASTAQTGYVLAPYQTTEITGWRKSLTEAAAFYFTALPDSYAARTDRPDNVGVIGAAVFREKRPEPLALPAPSYDATPAARVGAAAADSSNASRPASPAAPESTAKATREERLGTGHGEREYAPTVRTAFERAGERPNEVLRIRYDSVDNLVALGVIRPRRPAPAEPEPFPAFVPDPKG